MNQLLTLPYGRGSDRSLVSVEGVKKSVGRRKRLPTYATGTTDSMASRKSAVTMGLER